MKVEHLVWIPRIVEKLRIKHGVERWEVREVFHSKPKFHFVETGRVQGEHVYRALGRTGAGRYLAAFFLYKRGSKALIISARDMTQAERRLYGKA